IRRTLFGPGRGAGGGREICGITGRIANQAQGRQSAVKRIVEILTWEPEAAGEGTHQGLCHSLHCSIVSSNNLAPPWQSIALRQRRGFAQGVTGHGDSRPVSDVAADIDALFAREVSRLYREPAAIDVAVFRRELASVQAVFLGGAKTKDCKKTSPH